MPLEVPMDTTLLSPSKTYVLNPITSPLSPKSNLLRAQQRSRTRQQTPCDDSVRNGIQFVIQSLADVLALRRFLLFYEQKKLTEHNITSPSRRFKAYPGKEWYTAAHQCIGRWIRNKAVACYVNVGEEAKDLFCGFEWQEIQRREQIYLNTVITIKSPKPVARPSCCG